VDKLIIFELKGSYNFPIDKLHGRGPTNDFFGWPIPYAKIVANKSI